MTRSGVTPSGSKNRNNVLVGSLRGGPSLRFFMTTGTVSALPRKEIFTVVAPSLIGNKVEPSIRVSDGSAIVNLTEDVTLRVTAFLSVARMMSRVKVTLRFKSDGGWVNRDRGQIWIRL